MSGHQKILVSILLATFFCTCRYDHQKFAYILAGDKSSEGIVYVDLPDTTMWNYNPYNLDPDSDGSEEFQMETYILHSPHSFDVFYHVAGLNDGYLSTDSGGYILKFEQGERIGRELNWSGKRAYYLLSFGSESISPPRSYSHGYWAKAKNKYVGFKVVNSKSTIYGWMRIDINDWNFTLKDYAYRE